MHVSGLEPVLGLIVWTTVVWLWLYSTRIPAMKAAKIHPDSARHPGTYGDKLPAYVRSVADNHNHLHEQPTVFYAIMFFAALTGGLSPFVTILGWAYVGLRVVHSLVQILSGRVIIRFGVFCVSSVVLGVIIATQVLNAL